MFYLSNLNNIEFRRPLGAKDKKKRKSKLLRNLGIGAGVLGAAGLGYLALKGKKPISNKIINNTKTATNAVKKAQVINKKEANSALVKARREFLEKEYTNATDKLSPDFDFDFRYKAMKEAPYSYRYPELSKSLDSYNRSIVGGKDRDKVRQALGNIRNPSKILQEYLQENGSNDILDESIFPLSILARKQGMGKLYKITAERLRDQNRYFSIFNNIARFNYPQPELRERIQNNIKIIIKATNA